MILPSALLLDVTRRCNALCRICGRRFWPANASTPDMDLGLALRLIELPSIDRVCFGQYGEPLLWPHLVRAVRHATDLGRSTWMTTNGQLLSEVKTRTLLDARIGKIILSIDALDPLTYERLRPGLTWAKVIAHLDQLVTIRNQYHHATEIVVNLVRSPENAPSSDADVRAYFLTRGVDGVAITPEIDVSPPKTSTLSGPPIQCERPYDHLTIRADGQLMLCCRDCHDVAGDLGDATDPIAAYNGVAFTRIRRALDTGLNMPSICVGCRAHWPDCRKPVRSGAL